MNEVRAFQLLAADGLRNAARRRVVPAVAVLCLLTIMGVESCTSCDAQIQTNGGVAEQINLLASAGVAMLCILALWCVTLAGLLASDHLSSPLEDGSGLLVLTRPLKRRTFALARLVGSLTISLIAALLILGATAVLLALRGGLPLLPALLAIVVTACNCVTIAAFSMMSSLYLPRVVTFLLVFFSVFGLAIINLMGASGVPMGQWSQLLNNSGPPILTALTQALGPWSGQALAPAALAGVVLRLLLWSIGSVFLLIFVFDRQELTRFEPR